MHHQERRNLCIGKYSRHKYHQVNINMTLLLKRLLLTAMLLASLVLLLPQVNAGSAGQNTFATVVVKPGDTLWRLAQQIAPGDPRKTVYAIRKANNLESATIYPGQELIIPQ